ncbi:MAG: DUF5908 family protein [Bacteroidota bacterium]
MPLEIRELVIRTQIVTERVRQEPALSEVSVTDRKALIEECVEIVLNRIQRIKER